MTEPQAPTARATPATSPRRPTSTLRLPAALRACIEAWAVESHPRESCGLLIGTRSPGRTLVLDVSRARNLDHAADRYTIDPIDFLAADTDARASVLEVVGVWHSHPHGGAVPSAIDRAEAHVGWSYVIVATLPGHAWDLRSWRLDQGAFVAETLVE